MSDYWKKVVDDYKQVNAKSSSGSTKTGNYWRDVVTEYKETEKKKKKKKDEDDIAPVRTTKEDDERLDFFQKGAFEDGYQAGDVTKTILGTAGDVGLGLFKGVAGIGEGIADLASYGVAGVADRLGNEEYADRVRKKASENFWENVTKGADDYLNQYSVLGRTSDAAAQGIGQIGAIIATGGLGAAAGLGTVATTILTSGVIGASSAGSAMGEAYQGGASDEEATQYGLTQGFIDAGTELLFGALGKTVKAVGLSKGLSQLDDIFARKLSSKITNQTAKNFTEYGIKASFEGFEEILAGIGSAVNKKITYMSDKELSDLIADENLLEQFVVGTVTSGIAQSGLVPGMKKGSLVEANKTGRDFVSGMTENEQKVVDKVYNDLVAEEEKNGKLTNKRKSEIYDEVLDSMEKGYISTDTIEEVLGGEAYKTYKDTIDSEDAQINELEAQIKELEEAPNTVGNSRKYDSLTSQLEELKNNSQRDQLKSQLGDEVSKMVNGDRLIESYNDRIRRKQKYTDDVTKYKNEAAQKTIQNAIDSGVINNGNHSHEMVDSLAKISAKRGTIFNLTNNKKLKESGQDIVEGVKEFQADGTSNEFSLDEQYLDANTAPVVKVNGEEATNYKFEDGKIVFNESLAEGDNVTVTYKKSVTPDAFVNEDGSITINIDSPKYWNRVVGHDVTHTMQGTKHYSSVQKVLYQLAQTKGEYDIRRKDVSERYSGVQDTTVDYELTADLVGDYLFDNGDFVNRLLAEDKNAFLKLWDEIKHLCKMVTAGSKELRQLEQAKHNFEKAWREGNKNTATNGGVQYHASPSKTNPKYLDPKTVTKKDVTDALNGVAAGKFNDSSYVPIRISTPGIVQERLFTRDLPMAAPVHKIAQAMKEDQGPIEGKNQRGHGFSVDDIVSIIEKMDSPDYLFEQPSNNRGVAVVSHETSEGKTAVFVEFDCNINPAYLNGYEGGTYNLAITPFNVDGGMAGLFEYAQKNKWIEVFNKEKEGDPAKKFPATRPFAVEQDSLSDNVAQETPPVKQFSLSKQVDADYMDAVKSGDTANAQLMVDEAANAAGYTVKAYHGTARSDRVGNVFLPERATSGPMAFFTDSKEIAENYARDKADTSLAYDEEYEDYYSQFRVNKDGKSIKVQDLWRSLPFSEKQRLKEAGKHITWDDDMTNIVWDDDATHGLGNWDAYTLNQHKGNAIEALIDCWLESGELFGNEGDFIQVLEMAGIKGVEYRDPDARHEKVYDTWLKIQKPFDTATVDEDFANDFEEWYSQQPEGKYARDTAAADMWDKNSQTAESFLARLREDIVDGTAHAWTSIPDSMTDYLKHLGHDGIKDTGGKNGGEVHTVWIPFSSEQIKSAEAVTYDDSGNVVPLSERFNPENKDIRYSLSADGEAPTRGRFGAPLREMRYEAPSVSETEVVSAENATTTDTEMFPDDLAPMADDPERFDSLTDEDAPPEMEAPYYEDSEATVDDPFEERDITEMGKRNVKAYMYENPEVKPFFQAEAKAMLGDLNASIKGEKWFNDEVYYETGGEHGWGGTKRATTDDIAYLLDNCHYTYAEIEKGLNAIIEDNGAENNAVSKRIEFMLNDRLLYGGNDVDGRPYPPNEDYIRLLNEKQITEYSKEAFDALLASEDAYAPISEEIAPVAAEKVKPARVSEPYEAIRPKPQREPRLARATPEEQARASVMTEEPKVDRAKPSAWNLFKDNFVDKGTIFETLSLKTGNRELQGRWKAIGRAESSAQWFMEHGNAETSSLKSIRETVEKSGKTQQFYEYLYHMHNVDRMNLADRYEDVENKPVFGYGVTSEMSKAEAAKLEKMNPEFKTWAKDVYSYMTTLREMMVDNGVISNETAKLWAEMYPHYVPVRRKGDDGLNINVALDTKRTGVNAPVKRATGGNRDILPLFDTMAMRTEQTFKAVARNRFGVELKNMLGTTIKKEMMGIDEAIDSVANEELLQEGKDGMNPTFTVFENGEKVTFEITDEMYDTMKPKSKAMSYTNKALNTANNIRRGLLTEYNPAFMLTNPIKDTQDVILNSQHPAKTYANYPKAIAELLGKKGQYYQEYMEHGGEQNTYFDGESKTFAKEKSGLSKTIGFPLEKISQANNFIERIPRMAEYIASRKEGRSIDVSMLDAARVTTDFSAGGDLVKFANRNGFTFLNASVQGAAQQVRNVREAKAEGLKGWAKLAAKVAAAGLPAALLNHLLWDDDEEYDELSDYVKQNYYIVGKYGDGKFVRIPKGRALAVIQNGFEQMENLVTGDDEVDMRTFGELVVSNLAPNNPLENNILAPLTQAANNTTWYGDDLVPTRLQDLPAAEQYDETTDSISKWLGEKLDISPYKINYVLDQYSGGVGDMLLPMLTPEAERGNNTLLAPILDKFTTDSVMKNQNVSDFYDTKDELATNAKASGATEEDVLMSKYMNSINAELSDLYKQKREIQNSDLADEEKYDAVREIQRQIVELTKEGLETYPDVSVSGEYAVVGDRHYRRNSDGEWTKLTDKQLEKQEEVTTGLDISASEYWGNKEEYDYAYEYPDKYAVAKSVGGYEAYKSYSSELYDIKADKDSKGKSISGSRKEKVLDYINNLDADYGTKIILFKSEYNADDTYNYEIIEYLNSRQDISYKEMEAILKELGFEVSADGTISW